MRPKAASRGVPASGIWGPVLGSAPGQLEAGPLGGPQPASGVPLAAISEHNQASTTEPRSLLARNLPRQPFPDPARSLSASYRGPLPFDAPSFAGVGPQLLEAQRGWQGRERRILKERPGLQALVPQRLIVLVEVLDGSLVRPQPLGRLAVLGQFDCDARHGANRTGSLHRERGGAETRGAALGWGAAGPGALQRTAGAAAAGDDSPAGSAWAAGCGLRLSRPAWRLAPDAASRGPAQRQPDRGGLRGRCCHLRTVPGMARPGGRGHSLNWGGKAGRNSAMTVQETLDESVAV